MYKSSMNKDQIVVSLARQRYSACIQCIIRASTSVYTAIVICFLIDIGQFFLCNMCIVPFTSVLYCVLLPVASMQVLIFNGCWIALSSLYAHGFMFLHLITLIPLSIGVMYVKRFVYRTVFLPLCTIICFVMLDSVLLWLIGLTTMPFTIFTIMQIVGIMVSTWALSRALWTGEQGNRTAMQ